MKVIKKNFLNTASPPAVKDTININILTYNTFFRENQVGNNVSKNKHLCYNRQEMSIIVGTNYWGKIWPIEKW